jgi:hypothetical protein
LSFPESELVVGDTYYLKTVDVIHPFLYDLFVSDDVFVNREERNLETLLMWDKGHTVFSNIFKEKVPHESLTYFVPRQYDY